MGEESRRAPRYSRRLRVDLEGGTIWTSNLSDGGMQLAIPELEMDRFRKRLSDGVVELDIHLPGGERLSAQCRVAYLSEYDDEYLVGVKFLSFSGDGRDRYTDYLTLKPA
ncbi:MAG: PilZ domain-containing protein [Gammaproteobacteria bacterium]|nr:MAG: PilZ domain-containing protein [Gammaproteobacteria bacterium]